MNTIRISVEIRIGIRIQKHKQRQTAKTAVETKDSVNR